MALSNKLYGTLFLISSGIFGGLGVRDYLESRKERSLDNYSRFEENQGISDSDRLFSQRFRSVIHGAVSLSMLGVGVGYLRASQKREY